MPGHYTNTSSIVSNSNISASTLRGILDDLDDATYAVETANVVAMPPGCVVPYAGSTEPVGWLFCYGQAISRSSYAALFAVISTQYGVGDGSSTFNLPDLRGRVPIAKDNMGGSSANRVVAAAADTLGGSGGAENHTLSASEIPAHNHQILRPGSNSSGGGSQWWQGNSGTNIGGIYTENNTGGGGSHNNMQPYIALNYIIKT